jgi:D-serine deaminase-like pyridoxal phosphate-dependent protein
MPLLSLPTPALLLDLDVMERNLRHMAERAETLGVTLRPHIKTHKCIEVGERQRALGARGITVSTLEEARAFADHGFNDLTWAFPVNLSRLDELRDLAARITLRVVVDSSDALRALEHLATPLNVWLKIDCGYHRAGVDPSSRLALDLARAIADAPTLAFDGILSHSGHAYHEHGAEALRRVAAEERDVMVACAERLRAERIVVPCVSVGSTPAMSAAEDLTGVTEARPGNYVFYDHTQVLLGSCAVTDCAVTVLASVVSAQPGATYAVTDAGALVMSKDTGLDGAEQPTMGPVYDDYGSGTLSSTHRLTALSQEHGVAQGPLPVGTRLRILPNHSCLTVACFDQYHVVQGDEVIDRWKIWRARDT